MGWPTKVRDMPESKQHMLTFCGVSVVVYVFRICIGGVDGLKEYMCGKEGVDS